MNCQSNWALTGWRALPRWPSVVTARPVHDQWTAYDWSPWKLPPMCLFAFSRIQAAERSPAEWSCNLSSVSPDEWRWPNNLQQQMDLCWFLTKWCNIRHTVPKDLWANLPGVSRGVSKEKSKQVKGENLSRLGLVVNISSQCNIGMVSQSSKRSPKVSVWIMCKKRIFWQIQFLPS